ncbi:MAG: outer membrane protein [Marinoscillum sp.]|jgi:outer membrane protein
MKKLFFAVGLIWSIGAQSQESVTALTLDDCVETAMNNNIGLMKAKNGEVIAESNRMQAIFNFFPSVSAGINYDFFFGNFFDTNAARQVSATTSSSAPNLSSSLTLFNGFSNQYRLSQSKQRIISASENTKSTALQVEADIMSAYLNVILDKENITIARERVELLKSQLEREVKRESVGVGNLESVYNFQGQLANQKLTLNNLENNLKRNLLTLFQAMQLDPNAGEYEVLGYEIQEEDLLLEAAPFSEVLESCISNNPTLKSAQANYLASKYTLKSSKAQRLPTVTAFGRIGSNYSTNGARNPTTGEFLPDATLSDQMTFNEFEYVNFSMNIPLFTRFQTSGQVQVNKVAMINAELDVTLAMNNVTNLVQTAYLDLVTAQNTYVSAKENLEVATQTFDFMKKRFETGNTDFFTYMESLNNKNRAQLELVNSKYSIVFRQKILELYQGS